MFIKMTISSLILESFIRQTLWLILERLEKKEGVNFASEQPVRILQGALRGKQEKVKFIQAPLGWPWVTSAWLLRRSRGWSPLADRSWCEQHHSPDVLPTGCWSHSRPECQRGYCCDTFSSAGGWRRKEKEGACELWALPFYDIYHSRREWSELSWPRFLINTGKKWEIRENVNSHFNFTKAAWEGVGGINSLSCMSVLKGAIAYNGFYWCLWLAVFESLVKVSSLALGAGRLQSWEQWHLSG